MNKQTVRNSTNSPQSLKDLNKGNSPKWIFLMDPGLEQFQGDMKVGP